LHLILVTLARPRHARTLSHALKLPPDALVYPYEWHENGLLLATMTALTGAGTAINLFGGFYDYNYAPSEAEADILAIFSDWAIVGDDLRNAMASSEAVNKHQLELALTY